MADLREVEVYVIRVALSQGWITREALERAATFRSKQTERGRKTELLKVLRPFVKPADYASLERTWKAACEHARNRAGPFTATDIGADMSDSTGRPPPPRPPTGRRTAIDALTDEGGGWGSASREG